MAFINWDNSFSVGVDDIDKQHQKLIELINELHDAMMCGKDDTVLESVLASVADYTDYHFRFEESLMDETAYPESAQHKAAHQELKTRLQELQADFPFHKPGANMRVMEFLQNWLIGHVITADQDVAMGAYIAAKMDSRLQVAS